MRGAGPAALFKRPQMITIDDEFGRSVQVEETGSAYRTHLAERARRDRVNAIWREGNI